MHDSNISKHNWPSRFIDMSRYFVYASCYVAAKLLNQIAFSIGIFNMHRAGTTIQLVFFAGSIPLTAEAH
jgi:hypothetical protein